MEPVGSIFRKKNTFLYGDNRIKERTDRQMNNTEEVRYYGKDNLVYRTAEEARGSFED